MFDELKKKTFKKSLFGAIVMLLVGAFLVCYTANNAFHAVAGYKEFTQLAPGEIRPNHIVELNLDTNFGYCIEEYEYNSDTYTSRTTDLYYVIWTGEETDPEFRYMTIKVPASYKSEMEDMAENTYNEVSSESIYFCGQIKEMNEEEYSYFKEYFLESDWTEEEFEEGTLPYYIDTYASKTSMDVVFSLVFVLGVIVLLCGLDRLIRGPKGKFLKKLHKDIAAAGYMEDAVAADYAQAVSYGKKDVVRVGRLMTYYYEGIHARAIPNNKIAWAYQNTVTHRRNGIKTGTTYSLTIVQEGPVTHSVDVPSALLAENILQQMGTMFPWIIIGYSEQLSNMAYKDHAQFLNLRYNTCEHVPVEPEFENQNQN